MKRKVVQEFFYAADGINAKKLKPGRSYSFKPEDAARFEAEGKIAPEGEVEKPKRVRKARDDDGK